jgi:hypothetical protein
MVRYAKSRKRHMHNEHGIDSRHVLKFYQERSSDEDWWREHR